MSAVQSADRHSGDRGDFPISSKCLVVAQAAQVSAEDPSIRRNEEKTVKSGGARSVFMGLFLFFIVMPIVVTVGCMVCATGFIASQATKHDADSHLKIDDQPQSPAASTAGQPLPKADDQAGYAPPANPGDDQVRIWHDKKGHEIEAAFRGTIGEGVTLERADGKRISVPLSILSDEDQEWVKSRSKTAQ
jgi:SLA1 homology domain 1, SHD1